MNLEALYKLDYLSVCSKLKKGRQAQWANCQHHPRLPWPSC
jgi:hypothetical protein